jgi:hypothetical protein
VAGDPVNSRDPFGLCADSLRGNDGRCPGGLTVRQWERVEYAAKNRMTAEARDLVLELLYDGKISAADVVIVNFERMAAKASPLTRRITIAEASFAYSIGDFAALLAHEGRHTQQLFTWPGEGREADADAYSCAHTWGREGYRAGGYRKTLGPCGSGLP